MLSSPQKLFFWLSWHLATSLQYASSQRGISRDSPSLGVPFGKILGSQDFLGYQNEPFEAQSMPYQILGRLFGFALLQSTLVYCQPVTAKPANGAALSLRVVVDQFGYPPESEKIAIIRAPHIGYDALGTPLPPPDKVDLIDKKTGRVVLSAKPIPWHQGQTDDASGDAVWWFDFSGVTTPGIYYVSDAKTGAVSPDFPIKKNPYCDVLRQAVRTFFYQRSGFAKEARFAGAAWADEASHLQDKKSRRFLAKSDSSTERDLHGGWYDAGDLNKYTPMAAGYIVQLLRAYSDRPEAFSDATHIPESGNGIPDILDEALWGLAWLKRMQLEDGSLLTIVGAQGASPPSKATDPSYYGDPSTSATLRGAQAFAYASRVFSRSARGDLRREGEDFLARAEKAFTWAVAHPNVVFRNNDAASGTSGLGSGQQETDDAGRRLARLGAAIFLFDATKKDVYHNHIDSVIRDVNPLKASSLSVFDDYEPLDLLLYYAAMPDAKASLKEDIKQKFRHAMSGDAYMQGVDTKRDAYLSYLPGYYWSSNQMKAAMGQFFDRLAEKDMGFNRSADARQVALHYLHYLHGVNPFSLVYLSNMGAFGATRSVTSFYHSWFSAASPRWSKVTATTPGPAPGFLVGGPNSQYKVDGCCPFQCGSRNNNAKCSAEPLTPPLGQPPLKSFKDFNADWPLNSWELTENSNHYQVKYIRLLSRFVEDPGQCSL